MSQRAPAPRHASALLVVAVAAAAAAALSLRARSRPPGPASPPGRQRLAVQRALAWSQRRPVPRLSPPPAGAQSCPPRQATPADLTPAEREELDRLDGASRASAVAALSLTADQQIVVAEIDRAADARRAAIEGRVTETGDLVPGSRVRLQASELARFRALAAALGDSAARALVSAEQAAYAELWQASHGREETLSSGDTIARRRLFTQQNAQAVLALGAYATRGN